MKGGINSRRNSLIRAGSFLLPLFLFWVILLNKAPASFSRQFHSYSLGVFLVVLILYCLSFWLPDRLEVLVCLSLTMFLMALSLSYLWTSGFSDNFVIGGLLPYKDAKNYYIGATMILKGIPVINVGQSTERPLFPGFLAVMLFLTGQNLKIALAILVQAAGIGLYLAARQIRSKFGVFPAGLFACLLYFHIQPMIGYTMSETLGFLAGCVGFTMIWLASYSLKRSDFLLGMITLMVAISTRPGAFFIFPMLALWIGWVFREEKRFSLKMSVYTMIIAAAGYVLINSIYARFLGIPPGYSFGNFSYALYGQVRGGAGWHSAIEELGTRDPSIVFRAALDFFLEHPMSLFIGFAKSYRDFFLFGERSIFPFWEYGRSLWPNFALWIGLLALVLRGLVRLVNDIRSNNSSLLVAGFIGVFLSIPFLPPIDGGARFYASTMPFLFVLAAVGSSQYSNGAQGQIVSNNQLWGELITSRWISTTLLVLALLAPPVIFSTSQKPSYIPQVCPLQQKSFVLDFRLGSYIDLVKDGANRCGLAPEVCLNDFERNNTEKATDDYYQVLLTLAENNDSNVRLISAFDLIGNRSHYFYIPHDKLPNSVSAGLLSGCAIEIVTKNQSIYQVQSVLP